MISSARTLRDPRAAWVLAGMLLLAAGWTKVCVPRHLPPPGSHEPIETRIFWEHRGIDEPYGGAQSGRGPLRDRKRPNAGAPGVIESPPSSLAIVGYILVGGGVPSLAVSVALWLHRRRTRPAGALGP